MKENIVRKTEEERESKPLFPHQVSLNYWRSCSKIHSTVLFRTMVTYPFEDSQWRILYNLFHLFRQVSKVLKGTRLSSMFLFLSLFMEVKIPCGNTMKVHLPDHNNWFYTQGKVPSSKRSRSGWRKRKRKKMNYNW